MGRAILATVLFWPLGLAAFVQAARVHKRWAGGDWTGAIRASELARRFAIYATWCGVFWWAVLLLLTN